MFCCGRIRSFVFLRLSLGLTNLCLPVRGEGRLAGLSTLRAVISVPLGIRRRCTHRTNLYLSALLAPAFPSWAAKTFLPVLLQRLQTGLPSSHLTLRTMIFRWDQSDSLIRRGIQWCLTPVYLVSRTAIEVDVIRQCNSWLALVLGDGLHVHVDP